MLLLGALLPDLIDTPVGLLFYEQLGGVRLISHGLIFAAVVMVAVVLSTRRGRPRKMWMPLAIGLLFHLLLDALWLDPETLWWPLLGGNFTPAGADSVGGYLADLMTDWKMWIGEGIGFAYLVYLGYAAALSEPESRKLLLSTGRVNVPIDGEAKC